MYSRVKTYFTYPIICTASLVNMTGNTVFRTINAMQFIYGFFDFTPNKMHPAVFVPAVINGFGTAIVTSSTKFGAIENKMFKQQLQSISPTDEMEHPLEQASLGRRVAGATVTYSLSFIGIIAGIVASLSYYLGGRTLTTALLEMTDQIRDSSGGQTSETEGWKDDFITYTALILMLAQAFEFFSYDLDKTFQSAKRIGHLVEMGEFLSECKSIDKRAATKTLGFVGFTVLFAPIHAVFTTKPSLEVLPFEMSDAVIDNMVYIAAFAHTTKLVVGELPSIYEKLKRGISHVDVPDTNLWKIRVYMTYTGMAFDGLAAGLTSFRSLSYTAEDFGGNPHDKALIAPAILNGISGASKVVLFSGMVGLSDRINDWKKRKVTKDNDSKSDASLSPLVQHSYFSPRSGRLNNTPTSPGSEGLLDYIELVEQDQPVSRPSTTIQIV